MKRIKIYLVLVIFLIILFFVSFFGKNLLRVSFDPDVLYANLARIWSKPTKGEPILKNYPFPLLFPPVTIAEGFEAYDGNLFDMPGGPHWAIDYIQKDGDVFKSFPVYSAHEGEVFQGAGKTWGKFVVVKKRGGAGQNYNTLYSHLDNIPDNIPFMKYDINGSSGVFLDAGTYIGDASVTGNTKGINQLHFELHIVDINTGTTLRADPYGVYGRVSSGLYPSPGNSLKGLFHDWVSDEPPFALQ